MAAAPGSSKSAVAASVDPRDYQWGPLNMATQQQLFAQFMSMTQMALMCGCALLPPPGLCPPPAPGGGPPGAGPPLPPAFAPFWPPGRPPLAAPVPLPPGIPLPDKPASPAPPTTPGPATPRGPSVVPDLALAKAASAPAPSLARAASCTTPKASTNKKRGGASNKAGSKTSKAPLAPVPVPGLPLPPATPCGAPSTPLQSGAASGMLGGDGCDLDPDHDMRLLEALPLDLDDIRQLFQEDLVQELEHHDSLSGVSQGSHNTCFAAVADAAAAAAAAGSPSRGGSVHLTGGAGAECPSKHLLVESLDGPLSLASFDQSFEQLSTDFKSLSNSFDALHDLGDILDVNMDDDFVAPIVPVSLAPSPCAPLPSCLADDLSLGAAAAKLGASSAGKKQEVCQKALKVNRGRGSNSGISKSRTSMDKGVGGAKATAGARGGSGSCATLVDAPMEELLGL